MTTSERLYICIVMVWALLLGPDQGFADSAFWGDWVNDIAIDPANPETVYTVSGNIVFKSIDGGDSWEPIFNAKEDRLYFVKCSRTESGTLYAGGFTQIFKSTDSGKYWTLIFEGLPYTLEKFVVADAMPQRLYLVVRLFAAGLYRSDDGRATWVKLSWDISRFPWIVLRPPVNEILLLSAYTPSPVEIIPITSVQTLPVAVA